MSAVSTVLTLLAVAAMFAAIVGLFKPSLVMRWGKPTRLKAFLVYFLLMAVLSLGIDAPPKPPHSPAPSATVASESALATSADAVDALPAQFRTCWWRPRTRPAVPASAGAIVLCL